MSKLISIQTNSIEYHIKTATIPAMCQQWLFGNPNEAGNSFGVYTAEVGNTVWQVPESGQYIFEMAGGESGIVDNANAVKGENAGALIVQTYLSKDDILEIRTGGDLS